MQHLRAHHGSSRAQTARHSDPQLSHSWLSISRQLRYRVEIGAAEGHGHYPRPECGSCLSGRACTISKAACSACMMHGPTFTSNAAATSFRNQFPDLCLQTVPSCQTLFKNTFMYHTVTSSPPDFKECFDFIGVSQHEARAEQKATVCPCQNVCSIAQQWSNRVHGWLGKVSMCYGSWPTQVLHALALTVGTHSPCLCTTCREHEPAAKQQNPGVLHDWCDKVGAGHTERCRVLFHGLGSSPQGGGGTVTSRGQILFWPSARISSTLNLASQCCFTLWHMHVT